MGRFVEKDGGLIYQQEDGEITARLTNFKEKMQLGHEGSPRYKKVFNLLVSIGVIYLILVFIWV